MLWKYSESSYGFYMKWTLYFPAMLHNQCRHLLFLFSSSTPGGRRSSPHGLVEWKWFWIQINWLLFVLITKNLFFTTEIVNNGWGIKVSLGRAEKAYSHHFCVRFGEAHRLMKILNQKEIIFIVLCCTFLLYLVNFKNSFIYMLSVNFKRPGAKFSPQLRNHRNHF